MVEFFLLMWFVLSFALGLWNHNRGNGFLIGFFLSFLLSPLIGFFIVVFTRPKKKKKKSSA
jgi:peptidoglycan/LPS O-acetylase OafA/YrhL